MAVKRSDYEAQVKRLMGKIAFARIKQLNDKISEAFRKCKQDISSNDTALIDVGKDELIGEMVGRIKDAQRSLLNRMNSDMQDLLCQSEQVQLAYHRRCVESEEVAVMKALKELSMMEIPDRIDADVDEDVQKEEESSEQVDPLRRYSPGRYRNMNQALYGDRQRDRKD